MMLLSVARHALLALWLVATSFSQAAELTGRVVGVIDGDTVDVLTDNKQLVRVRLSGIDAPERGQPFGRAAKEILSDLVFSKQAALEGDKRDRYGRLVAKVLVDGRDANLALVRQGYAWHYKKYQSEQLAGICPLFPVLAELVAPRHRRGFNPTGARRCSKIFHQPVTRPAAMLSIPAMFARSPSGMTPSGSHTRNAVSIRA